MVPAPAIGALATPRSISVNLLHSFLPLLNWNLRVNVLAHIEVVSCSIFGSSLCNRKLQSAAFLEEKPRGNHGAVSIGGENAVAHQVDQR